VGARPSGEASIVYRVPVSTKGGLRGSVDIHRGWLTGWRGKDFIPRLAYRVALNSFFSPRLAYRVAWKGLHFFAEVGLQGGMDYVIG
jgi:hypothetical protein